MLPKSPLSLVNGCSPQILPNSPIPKSIYCEAVLACCHTIETTTKSFAEACRCRQLDSSMSIASPVCFAPWPAFRGAASDSCLQGLGESIGAPRTFWISTGWTGRRPRMQERKVRDRQPSFLQWWQGAVASCWDEVCCFYEDSIHPCAEGVLLCAGPSGPGRGVGPAALALELPLPREEDKSKARDEAMLVPSCQSWCSTANNIYYFCDYYYYHSYSYSYYYITIIITSRSASSRNKGGAARAAFGL